MKRIYASNNPEISSFVDDEDYIRFKDWTWQAKFKHGRTYFQGWPYKTTKGIGTTKRFYLHRVIMNAAKGEILDHIDNNPLNNCKSNLRFCTQGQNMGNRKINKGKTYKGVSKYLTRSGTVFKVYLKGKFIGQFKCIHQAALLYDLAAKATYGEYARCNILDHGGD